MIKPTRKIVCAVAVMVMSLGLAIGIGMRADAAEIETPITQYVTADVLNVRQQPSMEATIVTTLSQGTKVKVVREVDDWSTIEIDQQLYYVCNQYLSDNQFIETASSALYTSNQFRSMGVIYYGGYKWTWYSQRVLAGGALRIPGRQVSSDGFVIDGNGYICLAHPSMAKGTIIDTPFGRQGKIYDTAGANVIDVYTNY